MKLAGAKAEFEARGVRIVAISVDPRSDSVALRERLGVEFPLLHDEGAAVAVAYGVAMRGDEMAVPSVFVVMPDRRVAWKYVGENAKDRPPEDRVIEEIDAALARQSADSP